MFCICLAVWQVYTYNASDVWEVGSYKLVGEQQQEGLVQIYEPTIPIVKFWGSWLNLEDDWLKIDRSSSSVQHVPIKSSPLEHRQ